MGWWCFLVGVALCLIVAICLFGFDCWLTGLGFCYVLCFGIVMDW